MGVVTIFMLRLFVPREFDMIPANKFASWGWKMERSEDSKHTGKLSDDEENKKRVFKI